MQIITGILVSLVVEGIKEVERKKGSKLNSFQTIAFVFTLSLFASLAYFLLNKFGFWESFLQIALVAGGFHNLVVRRLDSEQ